MKFDKNNPIMKKLSIIILVSIFTLSCNCKKNIVSNVNSENLHRKWMLVSYKNYTKDDLIKKEAFLDMTNKERASSKMGCNSMSFGYSVTGNAITFTQGMGTKMFCQDMNLETDFLNDLPKMITIVIEGHKMTLNGKDNEKMEFIAQDWD
ncbi:MAG TPA: hypothetical protein DC020_04060 [Flavobacterium sp.]|nr:hypothetical protein [Flavobacterium sp.]